MTSWNYKPRLGFDIRVRPPENGRAKRQDAPRACARVGCANLAQVAVRKSPRSDDRLWLCAAHATEHNRGWNFFDGLSASEAEAVRLATLYGDRPTWAMGKNERARTTAKARRASDFTDPFGFFADAAASAPSQPEPRIGRLQAKAFETLQLAPSAAAPDIRRRYAELVRRFHPDANGGDRSAEAQLQEVVKAHQILKKAGRC